MTGQLLTAAEVAERLRISQSLLYKLLRNGKLPGVVRLGASLRFNADAIDQLIVEGGTR